MKNKLLLIATILFLMIAASINAKAQWEETTEPFGEVSALVGSGSNIFAGFLDAGAAWSTDNGTSWTPSGFGEVERTCLALNGTYLLGAGDVGAYVSMDSGQSWTEDDYNFESTGVSALASIGTNFFAGTEGGVYLLTDSDIIGGFAWTDPDPEQNIGAITTIAVSGTNLFAGGDNGIFLSTDNAKSWTDLNAGLPDSNILALAVMGAKIFVSTIRGVFLSTNNGGDWSPMGNGPWGSSFNSFVVKGNDFFVSNGVSIYLSRDSGVSWQTAEPEFGPNYQFGVAVLGADSDYIFAGTGEGVWRRALSDFNTSSVSSVASTENSLSTYPNPFTSSTTINFTTPESGIATVTIMNILGTDVARIFSGELSAGEHSFLWGNPTGLPDGMYECIVQMNGNVERTPIVLAR